MSSRRDFLKQGSAVAGAVALTGAFRPAEAIAGIVPAQRAGAMDASIKDLLMEALNAAKSGGSSFADARIGRYLQNFVVTREQQIINVVDTDSIGIGVRALVNGRSEEHTSELQSLAYLVCRLLLEKKKKKK